jgi:ferrous iron transport protein B
MTSSPRILIIGNPNSGKTSLFNKLTGLQHKTANYPGVTVEVRSGTAKILKNGELLSCECTDLPGIYSLFPDSEDEVVACREILRHLDTTPENSPVPVYVADSTNLRRSLFLFTQLLDLGIRPILVLNMTDLAEKSRIQTNDTALSKHYGVPVIPMVSRGHKSVNQLKELIRNYIPEQHPDNSGFRQQILSKDTDSERRAIDAEKRYAAIDSVVAETVTESTIPVFPLTRKVDRILLHPVWGITIFLGILFLMFQALYTWSSVPMELIESVFASLTEWIRGVLPKGKLTDLFTEGVMPGLAGILVFVPQIAFLFFFIALMEESGYMARVSFLADRLMRPFGLNGRSVIPLIGGAACAVPSIMAARTISNRRERLVTILVTPLISCSARLPVYAVLIALVIPDVSAGPFLNARGLVLMGLYLAGLFAALFSALIFSRIIPSTEKSLFILEMPSYRYPDWKNVWKVISNKVQVFIWDAGRIILAISIVLWVLASYAPPGKMEEVESEFAGREMTEDLRYQLQSRKLEVSYAGMAGKWIEPAIEPLGYDWKTGIALITSFAAREVFVGTMSTIYSVGEEADVKTLTQKMKDQVRPDNGKPRFDLATGISLMLFYAFAMQCMSTLAVVKRETGNYKIPLIQFLYMGALAYLSAWLAYVLLS